MELAYRLAEFAEQLPIGKKLGQLNFSQPGILIGETACGKSLVTPILAFLTGGFRRIIVRQPTRLASYLAMKSMYDIYGDKISVGCINRDQKINPEAPILEITDGILVDWLRDKQIWYDELLILDEIHATSEQLEIAMGLIKRQGLHPWCLTATIDPGDIIKYFNADVHYVSGINYTIHKKQIFKELREFLFGNKKEKGYIKEKMLEQGNSCLVFLPTRYETELWASEIEQVYEKDIICKYVHGGIDVQEMAPFSHKKNLNKPFILFSTPVSEQSITLDLDDVIIVNQKIVVTEYMGVKIQQRTPLPANSLIQMMGRCGRYREGHVYVICDYFSEEIDFKNLRPTPVSYTLSNNTPFELAIILADRQIKLEDVDLITNVNRKEYEFAVRMLKKRKLIDHHGRLTKEGDAVMAIPLDYNLAQFVATAPDDILDIVIFAAGFGSHGLYHMEKLFPDGTPWDVIKKRRRLGVAESDLLTKYNIAKEFYGLSEEEMKIHAQELGLNLHVITNALNAASSVYEHIAISPPVSLPNLNKELIKKFQEHVFNILLFPPIKVSRDYNRNSYNCYIDEMRAFTDSASSIQGEEKEIIFSSKTQVESRYGEWFIRLSDNTICPKKLREWCWPEKTVKDFLKKALSVSENKGAYYKISQTKYPATDKFLKSASALAEEFKKLYHKSPGKFKNERIGFEEILEDTLVNICIDERIKNLNSLETYLEKENIPEPTIEDYISLKERKYIYDNYIDQIEIKGKSYPLSYNKGEMWVELPYELVMELSDGEIPVTNFSILIKHENGNINKIYSRGLLQAREDIKNFITQRAWKTAKKDYKQKVNPNQIPNMLKKILSQIYVTDFLGETIYGWTGIKYDGNIFNLSLLTSYEQADKETRKSLNEYFRRMVQSECHQIKHKLPGIDRKKNKKELNKKMHDIEHWCMEEIRLIDISSDPQNSLKELLKKLKNRISEIKELYIYGVSEYL